MSIKSNLKNNDLILLKTSSVNLHKQAIALLKQLKDKKIIYVTCNKTVNSLIEELKKKKIKQKNILFIDLISKTLYKVDDSYEQCLFLNSPSSLTKLSLVLNKLLIKEIDLIIIDSVTNLRIYNKKQSIEKFFMSISNKIKNANKKAIFLAAKIDEYQDFLNKLETSVDICIEKK